MHGLSTLTRLNMTPEEIVEAAKRSAAAQPITPDGLNKIEGVNKIEAETPQTV